MFADTKFVKVRLYAEKISEHASVSYWTHETIEGYHAQEAIEELRKLASVLGFDLLKRHDPLIETIATEKEDA